MTVGSRIREFRKRLGLSVDDVAEKLGKNRATVYRYESDDIENLPAPVLEPLAKVLQTTPAELMGWKEKGVVQSTPLYDFGTPSFSVAEEIASYEKNVTETDLNKMLTSGGVLMFGDKKLTEEQKKVLLSVAAAMVKEDSDA